MEPRHECSRCKAGFPKENDGSLPWRDAEGGWRTDCPRDEVEEASEVIGYYNDWPNTHPVSLGRVPWLPSGYRLAMHYVRSVVDEFNEIERQKAEARAKRG